ncbi:hypothetical protein D3C71_1230680 [compost metagenome]
MQQAVLFFRQQQQFVVQRDLVVHRVQIQVAQAPGLGGKPRHAPVYRLHAGYQLRQGKRLCQKIICAGIQAVDQAFNAVTGGENNDRNILAGSAPFDQFFQAIAVGQGEIQQH